MQQAERFLNLHIRLADRATLHDAASRLTLLAVWMGSYLSQPVTTKESEDGGSAGGMRWGASAMQGWRKGMEDEHIAELCVGGKEGGAVFGVFDGHGGREVATFCKRYMVAALASDPRFGDTSDGPGPTAQALISAFHLMDSMMREPRHALELERCLS